MRICLVLEGSYPYVHGGVSTWMHAYIQAMPQQEFSLWVIGAKAQDRGKFVYELPPNVKEVEEVFLDDALRLHGEQHPVLFTADERTALRELVSQYMNPYLTDITADMQHVSHDTTVNNLPVESDSAGEEATGDGQSASD